MKDVLGYSLVDDLGVLQAEIAKLELRATAIKDALKHKGVGAYEGDFYRATVSETVRETLDMDAVRAKLSPQFIAANTKTTKVMAVRVVARTGEKISHAA